MTAIKELAEREKRAEANRRSADADWRQAWWATTMALGAITDKTERAIAVTTISAVTGNSPSWVQSRAKTGEAFAGISLKNVSKLPPRMAVELARQKVTITARVVKDLLKAEKDGMSLREFSRKLTGKSWADTPAGASEDTLRQIVAEQPELIGQLVARSRVASHAHDAEMLNRSRNEGAVLHIGFDDDHVRRDDWDSQAHVLTQLTLAIKRLRSQCDTPGDLTENAAKTIDWAIAELSAIKNGRDFVGEVEAWLEENTV